MYAVYHTLIVFAFQLIYIFELFHPHIHEYVGIIFLLFPLICQEL